MPLRDLTGQKFGRLTVIGRSSRKDSKGRVFWDCQCSCGNKKTIVSWSITSGATQSCGCLNREAVKNEDHHKNLIGRRFGKLVVIRYSEKFKHRMYWICKCDCGNTKEIMGTSLLTGRTKSCGCLYQLPDGRSAFNSVYGNYKRAAERRGLSFELSMDEFELITSKDCFYCGSKPSNICTNVRKNTSRAKYVYNGIDRIENSKGYTLENSVPCCGMCNKAKNKYSKEEFLDWIKRVYYHSIEKSEYQGELNGCKRTQQTLYLSCSQERSASAL